MGAAAGAAVRLRKFHNADLPGELLLAPVLQGRQLLRRGIENLGLPVRPDGLVGQPLRLQGLFPGNIRVVINGDGFRPQVKPHVVTVVKAAEDAADDVLPGVLLHVVEAAGPVQGSGGHRTGLHRGGAGVDYRAVLLVNIGNGNLPARGPQNAVVRRLAAPLGVEGRLVQDHLPGLPGGLAGEDGGGELPETGVLIVEFFRFQC